MTRPYHNYTGEQLETALRRIRDGLPQTTAAKRYGIPLSTLKNKLKKQHMEHVGRPLALSAEIEAVLASRADLLCLWGFPLDPIDVQLMVKYVLDAQGYQHSRFRNNIPGRDWTIAFFKRTTMSKTSSTNGGPIAPSPLTSKPAKRQFL